MRKTLVVTLGAYMCLTVAAMAQEGAAPATTQEMQNAGTAVQEQAQQTGDAVKTDATTTVNTATERATKQRQAMHAQKRKAHMEMEKRKHEARRKAHAEKTKAKIEHRKKMHEMNKANQEAQQQMNTATDSMTAPAPTEAPTQGQ